MDEPRELTRHEHGAVADMVAGFRPMESFTLEPMPRISPPFPLHTYLVLKHES